MVRGACAWMPLRRDGAYGVAVIGDIRVVDLTRRLSENSDRSEGEAG
ncbi:hypothetical protein [Nitrosomonas halophila]|nr:hypothetical protein [Nitrosomonas halophila]